MEKAIVDEINRLIEIIEDFDFVELKLSWIEFRFDHEVECNCVNQGSISILLH